MARRILIVDDSQDILDLVRRSVVRLGDVEAVTALNGYSGLTAVANKSAPVDIIVLDLGLPDIDGLEFLRQLVDMNFSGAVILASGHSRSVLSAANNLAEIHGIKVLDTLQKPFSPSALRQVIDGYTPSAQLGSADRASPADDLDGARLVPYYQPQFNINDGSITGFEALIRLALPDGPLVGPMSYFSRMRTDDERAAAALSIAELVIADIVSAGRVVNGFPRVSLNFDARVLENAEIIAKFTSMVAQSGIANENIVIEVIEKSLPKSDAVLLEALTRLRMAGFGISLDDYGVGGSNHDLLRRCPFSELKLDRSLIQSGLNDPLVHKFIKAAVDTANGLNIHLIAEGVENIADLDFVRQQGIDVVQGYLFQKPMPLAEAIDLLQQKQKIAVTA